MLLVVFYLVFWFLNSFLKPCYKTKIVITCISILHLLSIQFFLRLHAAKIYLFYFLHNKSCKKQQKTKTRHERGRPSSCCNYFGFFFSKQLGTCMMPFFPVQLLNHKYFDLFYNIQCVFCSLFLWTTIRSFLCKRTCCSYLRFIYHILRWTDCIQDNTDFDVLIVVKKYNLFFRHCWSVMVCEI